MTPPPPPPPHLITISRSGSGHEYTARFIAFWVARAMTYEMHNLDVFLTIRREIFQQIRGVETMLANSGPTSYTVGQQ